MAFNRRKFIKITSLAAGGSLFAVSCRIDFPGYYYFTEEEADCIIAVCEQIIPADKDPGATDACVINYIDKQLTGFYKSQQGFYRKGISALQKTCLRLNGKKFEEMESAMQKEFLQKMEKGLLPADDWQEMKQEQFLGRLIEHSMQGFYGSPRHGGNKDYVSYTMMGLDYPQVVGQNRYPKKN